MKIYATRWISGPGCKGASYFDTTMSFAMIRRGKIDITILGALQVSQSGDLANWLVLGKRCRAWAVRWNWPKSEKVVVVMSHTDQKGGLN